MHCSLETACGSFVDVVVSETRPADVFVSNSLDGPWEQLGTIKAEGLHPSSSTGTDPQR